jgi:hypothetical protein
LYSNDSSGHRGWKLAFDSISTDQFMPFKKRKRRSDIHHDPLDDIIGMFPTCLGAPESIGDTDGEEDIGDDIGEQLYCQLISRRST